MAYLPPSLSQRRTLTNVGGMPVGGASTLGGSGAAAAPVGGGLAPGGSAPASTTTPAGGRYSALRGFLDANQPAVDAAAETVAAPIEARAEEAVSLAGESATLPENRGGAEKAASASEARDDALSRIASASSGIVGDVPTAGMSQGAQTADALLYSRSAPIRDLQKWDPVLRALNPGYGSPYYDPPAPPPPEDTTYHPTEIQKVGDEIGEKLLGIDPDSKNKEWRTAAALMFPGYGTVANKLTSGKTGRYLDPTASGGLYDDIGRGAKAAGNAVATAFGLGGASGGSFHRRGSVR